MQSQRYYTSARCCIDWTCRPVTAPDNAEWHRIVIITLWLLSSRFIPPWYDCWRGSLLCCCMISCSPGQPLQSRQPSHHNTPAGSSSLSTQQTPDAGNYNFSVKLWRINYLIVIQLLLLATQLVHYNISDAVVALALSPVVDTIHISHCLTFPTCCSRAETQVLLS